MQKPCPRCRTVKPAAAFYRDASRPDGLSYYCRECTRALQRHGRHASIERIEKIESIESSASIE